MSDILAKNVRCHCGCERIRLVGIICGTHIVLRCKECGSEDIATVSPKLAKVVCKKLFPEEY